MASSQKTITKNALIFVPAPAQLQGLISERFKTKTDSKDDFTSFKNKTKKKLGEPHPSDYRSLEKLAKKFALVNSVISKISDFVIGPEMQIESENEAVKEKLEEWMKETRFRTFLRPWLNEALLKGAAYLEIAGLKDSTKENSIKTVDSNTMFVRKDRFGKTIGYTQFLGSKTALFKDTEIIRLNPIEIAHLNINVIGSQPYGLGIVFPALGAINSFLSAETSMHKLLGRKANSPIHVKVGNVEKDDYPAPADIDIIGKSLQYMNDCTEWVTGPNVEMKVIDFGNISEKFEGVIKQDIQLLSYAFQTPEILLGATGTFSGSADVQMEAWKANVKSFQDQIGEVIRTQIFDFVLANNGLIGKEYVIVWGLPSEEDKQTQLKVLKEVIMVASPGLKKELETRIATILDLDIEKIDEENTRMEDKMDQQFAQSNGMGEEENEKEKNIKPKDKKECIRHKILSEVLKGKAPQEIEVEFSNKYNKEIYNIAVEEEEELTKDYTLEFWVGEFLHIKKNILDVIESDSFLNLVAKSKGDLKLGRLSALQIEKVRNVMKDAFENNKGVRYMAEKLNKIGLKDSMRLGKDGKAILQISKENRPWIIARTETVRLRAKGALESFKSKNVKLVEFQIISAKPCPECEEFSGKIFTVGDAAGMIPLHVSCRCKWNEKQT